MDDKFVSANGVQEFIHQRTILDFENNFSERGHVYTEVSIHCTGFFIGYRTCIHQGIPIEYTISIRDRTMYLARSKIVERAVKYTFYHSIVY